MRNVCMCKYSCGSEAVFRWTGSVAGEYSRTEKIQMNVKLKKEQQFLLFWECGMGKNPNFFAGIDFHTIESKVLHVQVALAHPLLPGASPPGGWHPRQEHSPLATPALDTHRRRWGRRRGRSSAQFPRTRAGREPGQGRARGAPAPPAAGARTAPSARLRSPTRDGRAREHCADTEPPQTHTHTDTHRARSAPQPAQRPAHPPPPAHTHGPRVPARRAPGTDPAPRARPRARTPRPHPPHAQRGRGAVRALNPGSLPHSSAALGFPRPRSLRPHSPPPSHPPALPGNADASLPKEGKSRATQ